MGRVRERVQFYTGLMIAVNSIVCLLKLYKKKGVKFTNWVLAETAKEEALSFFHFIYYQRQTYIFK